MNEFEYNYTAPTPTERKEIENIRKKYEPSIPEKAATVDTLRRLDRKVYTLPKILSLTLGIVGLLVFGLGLTMCLEWAMLLWGSLVSLIGLVPLAFAYPVYKKTLKKRKEKYGEEILAISQALLRK